MTASALQDPPRASAGLQQRVVRFLLGDRPRSLLVLAAPTALALVLDLAQRGRQLGGYATQGKLIYLSSWLVSAGFWFLPLFGATHLWARARAGAVAFFALVVFPLATFCFPGQVLYRRVHDVYMGRNTLRLGITFRTTVFDWFASWAGPTLLVGIVGGGLLVTAGLALAARRSSARPLGLPPALAVFAFGASLVVMWNDLVDSRFLQAALPDVCFLHGLVHAAKVAVTGKGGARQGMSLRTPAGLPPLASARAKRPNVLLVLTESVRADVSCSDPPPRCTSVDLDRAVADRVPLGKLTTPAPNTFSSCVLLWTGLDVTADFTTAHAAPVLWELAHAVGYRTAYITSQNPNYEDFGLFVQRAGIDVKKTATDLGGMAEEQIGAPDERATAATLAFVKEARSPWFAVMHLANTHMPYRVAPDLQPHEPHAPTPVGDVRPFKNQYLNSVLMQERTLRAFFEELRATPGWDDTVVVFLSDHGEQFREHRGLYHNHTLFDEEVRVPGWLVAGKDALTPAELEAVATYRGKRTYTQDVHATVVDLFGLHDARGTLPLADRVVGRSLLRPRPMEEPMTLMATSTAVWEPTDARFGVMWGEHLLVGSPRATWACYEMAPDRSQKRPKDGDQCGGMLELARKAFAGADVPR